MIINFIWLEKLYVILARKHATFVLQYRSKVRKVFNNSTKIQSQLKTVVVHFSKL